MAYKLYLDDIRIPKSDGWTIVRSYNDFISTIKRLGLPSEISFDHDLGWDEANDCPVKDGYDCAKWLVENEIVIEKFNVHSANPVGEKNITALLTNYRNFMTNNGKQ